MGKEKVTLVLRRDQLYGNEGKSMPPGTKVCTIEIEDGLPGGIGSINYIKSALGNGTLVGQGVRPKSSRPKPPYMEEAERIANEKEMEAVVDE